MANRDDQPPSTQDHVDAVRTRPIARAGYRSWRLVAIHLVVEVGARTIRAALVDGDDVRVVNLGDVTASAPSVGVLSGDEWTIGCAAIEAGPPENLIEAFPAGIITASTLPLVSALIARAMHQGGRSPRTLVLLHPSWWEQREQDLLVRAAHDVLPSTTVHLSPMRFVGSAPVVVEVDTLVTAAGPSSRPPRGVSALGVEDAVVAYLLREVPTTPRYSEAVLRVLAGWALMLATDPRTVVVQGLGPPVHVPASVVTPAVEQFAGVLAALLATASQEPGSAQVIGGQFWTDESATFRLREQGWTIERAEDPLIVLATMIARIGGQTEQGVSISLADREPCPAPTRTAAVEEVEEVQYSVYRPARAVPARWWPLLVFVHRAEAFDDPDTARRVDPIDEVRRRAARAVEDETTAYGLVSADGEGGLVRGTELTIVPSIVGGEVNPPHAVLRWQEPVHQIDFRARVVRPESNTVRGVVRAYRGVLLVAEVPFRMPVGDVAAPPREALVASTAKAYRDVFVSYAHRDQDVVRSIIACCRATGDRFLLDTLELRSGQVWEPALQDMISRADVFQLFWSHHAMRSEQVRREWEFALGLGRESFVRPVFWQRPRPADASLGLPPPNLDRLHWCELPAVLHTPAVPAATTHVRSSSPPRSAPSSPSGRFPTPALGIPRPLPTPTGDDGDSAPARYGPPRSSPPAQSGSAPAGKRGRVRAFIVAIITVFAVLVVLAVLVALAALALVVR